MKTVIRVGFKGRNQLPLLMIWREYWYGGEVVGGDVIFNTMNLFRRFKGCRHD